MVAASLVSDDKVKEVKDKIKSNPNVEDLKEKYDNGTEILKNQLASFPKNVEDDSELKDFDDIVIDDSESAEADGKSAAESIVIWKMPKKTKMTRQLTMRPQHNC